MRDLRTGSLHLRMCPWPQRGPKLGLPSVPTPQPRPQLHPGPRQGAQTQQTKWSFSPGGDQLSLWAMGRQTPLGQPCPLPREPRGWGQLLGWGRSRRSQIPSSLHGTRHPISGRAPCGQLLSWTMVSEEEWARLGQILRTSGLRGDVTGEEEQTLLLCSLCLGLAAIYLAKKHIRRQGALVDYEKVGRPPASHPPRAQSSQSNPNPVCGPGAHSPGPRMTGTQAQTLYVVSEGAGEACTHQS